MNASEAYMAAMAVVDKNPDGVSRLIHRINSQIDGAARARCFSILVDGGSEDALRKELRDTFQRRGFQVDLLTFAEVGGQPTEYRYVLKISWGRKKSDAEKRMVATIQSIATRRGMLLGAETIENLAADLIGHVEFRHPALPAMLGM